MSYLNRWDPFAEIARLTDMNRAWAQSKERFAPAVDIFEEADAIVLSVEVPGLKPEEIEVQVENGVLTLSGHRKLENEEKREGYHRIERSYGSFTRSFVLPKTVDGDAVEAKLDAGVLRLRLPKRVVAEKKRIAVQSTDASPPTASA